MRRNEVAEALGLESNTGPRTVELQDGVVLAFRPPESVDLQIAGAVVAKLMAAEQAGAEGRRRYGLAGASDSAALMNPAVWEGVAEFCVNVELAERIVSDVSRQVGDERRSAPATVETFRELFRIGDNLDRFVAETRAANRGLLAAKKG
jgi:hypothetical protein